ncbi:MAG TPA: hypothetical protein VHK69_18540, partial [Chitinophagaceae bacterium]|nr:hypothetical protein [Chitinophagaceae bacterium]
QFLPQRYVLKLLKKRNCKMVGRNDLLQEYLELNHMTHSALMSYLKGYPLLQLFRRSHSKLNSIKPLRHLNLNFFPFKYIITKELIAFTKLPVSPAVRRTARAPRLSAVAG